MQTYQQFTRHCKDMGGSWLWRYDSAYTPRTVNRERERESVVYIHIFVISFLFFKHQNASSYYYYFCCYYLQLQLSANPEANPLRERELTVQSEIK